MVCRTHLVVGEGVCLRHDGGGMWGLAGVVKELLVVQYDRRQADGGDAGGAWSCSSRRQQLGAPIGDSLPTSTRWR